MLPRFLRSMFALMMVSIALIWTTGCGYSLHGRVIQGTTPGVEIVHEMDVRLRPPAGGGPMAPHTNTALMPMGAGVNNLEVSIYRDAQTLNKHLAARTRSDGDGDFSVNLGDFGTGWMSEQWQVVGLSTGFATINQPVKLPPDPKKWRLLITVAPGTSTPVEPELMEQVDKFK